MNNMTWPRARFSRISTFQRTERDSRNIGSPTDAGTDRGTVVVNISPIHPQPEGCVPLGLFFFSRMG